MAKRQFDLAAKQKQLAELLVLGDENGKTYSIAGGCEKLSIGRSTYYDWQNNNPDFVAYMDHVADTALRSKIAKYDRILDRIADGEDDRLAMDAIDKLYKRLGRYRTDIKLEADINGNKDIGDKSLDEIQRDIAKLKQQVNDDGDKGLDVK